MNIIYGLVLFLGCGIATASTEQDCGPKTYTISDAWQDMTNASSCTTIMKAQVQQEIEASLKYLAMGAYFARDSLNRPGFSDLFFKSANEEREHAIKIIEYLLMRGELGESMGDLLPSQLSMPSDEWGNGIGALKEALNLEAKVTGKIKSIIAKCETPDEGEELNNYHLVDYLTGVFLEEQYTGQRELAGKLSTLGKMEAIHGNLGEFLFDKKLLNGEL